VEAVVVLAGMGEHPAERFLPICLIDLGGGPLRIGRCRAWTTVTLGSGGIGTGSSAQWPCRLSWA
jgi:hypothetical protein